MKELKDYLYYEEENPSLKIYCGDCLEIMPLLPKVDLVFTDPPYGINRSGQQKTECQNPKHNRKLHEDFGWDKDRPSKELFNLLFQKSSNQIIWGANYFTEFLPPSMGWLVWDKGQDFSTSDCELAFTSFQQALRRKIINRGQIAIEGALHPTQKPLRLIRWAIQQCKYWDTLLTILDPFGGSGTTAVACKELKKDCTLIEINEKYCEIAKKRLQNTQRMML